MEREVTDPDGTVWSCVQAFTGLGASSPAAQAAAERAAGDDGRVTVVATPRGGAQTVRMQLPADWADAMDDAALLAALSDARDGG